MDILIKISYWIIPNIRILLLNYSKYSAATKYSVTAEYSAAAEYSAVTEYSAAAEYSAVTEYSAPAEYLE